MLKLALGYKRMLALFLCLVTVDAVLGTLNPLILRDIINNGIGGHDSQLVIELALLAAGIATLDMLVTLIQRYVSARIGESLIFDLRRRVFGHVQRMPIAFFTRTQTGALVSRLNNDIIGAQQAFTNTLGSVVSNIITVTIVIVAMLALSWEITLASLALLPLFVIPARLVGKKLQAITRERYMVSAEMNNTMTERFNVSGALLVKLFGTPALEQQRIRRQGRAGARPRGHLEPLQRLLLLVDVPAHVARDRAGVRLGWSALRRRRPRHRHGGGAHCLPATPLRAAQPAVERADRRDDRARVVRPGVRGARPRADDRRQARRDRRARPARPGSSSTTSTSTTRGPTRCRSRRSSRSRCSTRRPNHQVLSDVSFTVEPGELVALVGHSGAGKTTISNLVPRLYDVQSGAIRINGVDVRDATLASIRETIGVVTQDAHLFHDTIRANLEFAQPEATEAEMRDALGAAQILPLVDALPDGLDTVVGDRGYRFSGGEKQRIAIARLLLKAPRIVVLDEATAHLDSESEVAVQAALETALAGRTSIVIAHRLSTVRHADKILVVSRGQHRRERHARRAPREWWRVRRSLRDSVQAAGDDGRAVRYAMSSGTLQGVMPYFRAITRDRASSASAFCAYDIAAGSSPAWSATRIASSSSVDWSTSAIQSLAVFS